ncbi:maleylpyruvate isomerase family mycothiol-dependent enzyme [Marinactinospora rubrisoli]|uniref:Maleylpyruvate isomerase family mycothiol-dependent enzyme n=1 Tax=Marinactinospora rubrisoli TaxID=2715399 RepID=A0ABW2KKP9_9ACTN
MDNLGPAIDVRPLFPRERAALLDLLGSLGPDDWRAPTVCPGWDVHDLVAHLLNDQLRRLSGSRDGHAGPPFGAGETLPAYIHRVNGEFVRAARCASPRVMAELLGFLGPQLDELWAGRPLDGQADLPVSWAQAEPADSTPVWLDMAREYTEYWVHQQQIRDAVGRPGADDPALMAPVLDTFARALPSALHGLTRPPGSSVVLEVTGPAGGRWAAVRGTGRWLLGAPPGARPAAARVTLPQDAFWRLATRGIPATEARGRADVHGDPELVDAVTGLLAIVH